MIERVVIRNYRLFRVFDLEFSAGMNIVVGRNETGKSTLLEAISVAMTGRLNGRSFAQELSPYLVNIDATREFFEKLRAGETPNPPEITIEVYLQESEGTAPLRGTNNLLNQDECGLRIQAKLSPDFLEEYDSFIQEPGEARVVPVEYYRVEWHEFSGNTATPRSLPASASLIDASTMRWQAGLDQHLQRAIRSHLEPKEHAELSRQYRSLREEFGRQGPVKAINDHLKERSRPFTERDLTLALDTSQRNTWDTGLVAHLDDIPFPYIGRGEQSSLRTLLAVSGRAAEAGVVLIEEPENHLSFAALRRLTEKIESCCKDRQVIITTHSAYVLNKLGLENLILLGDGTAQVRLSSLPADTVQYFKKLAGFDTLRLVLAKGAILVEGPSDELVVQRAYLDAKGRLPIEDGIDVISVGRAHKRFLDVAVPLKRRVWVVTDNDGKTLEEVNQRFAGYLSNPCVTLHTCVDPGITTLEPAIAAENPIATLNTVLGTTCGNQEEIVKAMTDDKTWAALAIFESKTSISFPEYIRHAIEA